jgi:predicted acylesterase/phospholipase RssA
LIDGGLRSNLPTEVSESTGALLNVGVRLHSVLQSHPKERYGSLIRFSERISSIFMSEMEAKSLANVDVLISPDVEELSLSNFDRPQLVRAIQEGEQSAEKMIPQIRERLHAVQQAAMRVKHPTQLSQPL